MCERLDRISINPQVFFSQPCIRGTRIWVALVLDFLATGTTFGQILHDYPQLQYEDILDANRLRSGDEPRALARLHGCLRLEVDENFGAGTAWLFPVASHNTETVLQQSLSGSSDELIFDICLQENRCLSPWT